MKTIDDLKVEMPLVFEFLTDLQKKIADAEIAHKADMDRLRDEVADEDRYYHLASDKYDRFCGTVHPMRLQVDAIWRKIDDILAAQQRPLFVVPAGPARVTHNPD